MAYIQVGLLEYINWRATGIGRGPEPRKEERKTNYVVYPAHFGNLKSQTELQSSCRQGKARAGLLPSTTSCLERPYSRLAFVVVMRAIDC